MTDPAFKALADDAGLPTTDEAINAEFDKLRDEAGLHISNTSAFSPFWRFVRAAATTAVTWLVDFLLNVVLPQRFVRYATDEVLDIHASDVSLSRKPGAKAVIAISFTRTTTDTQLTINAGAVVQSLPINGTVYQLLSVADYTFAVGEASANIDCEAEAIGAAYNLAEGAYIQLADGVEGVTVNNGVDSLTIPGADVETNDELRDRIRNQFSAINQWHTDAVYRAIIAGFDGVSTDNVFFEHDAPRGPGTANAYVMLEQGNPSAAFIADIQAEITDNGNHGHGDDMGVYAMPESNHNIVATVWFELGTDETIKSEALLTIDQLIRCAFRQNTAYDVSQVRPWDVFSFSKLGNELHTLLPPLKNIDFNHGFINSSMDIPRLNTLTVVEHA